MSTLVARSISVANAGRLVCRNVDLSLSSGEIWGILGPNGIGKTTLLHILSGLRQPDSGTVLLNDEPVAEKHGKSLARQIGILFQDSQDTFPSSVLEMVMMGRYPHLPFWGWETAEDMRIAIAALEQVSLGTFAARQIDTLSGGERRRVAIAQLLAQQTNIWLLDEPTNHLDVHHQMLLFNLIDGRVNSDHGSVAMVLQDVNLASRFCTHVLLMIDADTRIQGPAAEVLTVANLQSLYQHRIEMICKDGLSFFYPV